jgi:hypothetical protein
MRMPVDVNALFPGALAYHDAGTFVQIDDRQLAHALKTLCPARDLVAQVGVSSALTD